MNCVLTSLQFRSSSSLVKSHSKMQAPSQISTPFQRHFLQNPPVCQSSPSFLLPQPCSSRPGEVPTSRIEIQRWKALDGPRHACRTVPHPPPNPLSRSSAAVLGEKGKALAMNRWARKQPFPRWGVSSFIRTMWFISGADGRSFAMNSIGICGQKLDQIGRIRNREWARRCNIWQLWALKGMLAVNSFSVSTNRVLSLMKRLLDVLSRLRPIKRLERYHSVIQATNGI
jgi:hypothetical protein